LTINRSTQNWIRTAINPLWNWLNATEFSWYGCRVTRVLKVMKLPINWQNWDLNQPREFQQELPRRLSRNGQRSSKILGVRNGTQRGKWIPTRILCHKNQEVLKLNRNHLRWVTVLLTGLCYLKGHLFKIGFTDSPPSRNVPRKRWISHTHPTWLWGYNLLKMSPPEPLLYGARWLPRRPYKIPHFIRSVGLLRGWNRGGGGCAILVDHYGSRCEGRSRPTPYAFIHAFISGRTEENHWKLNHNSQCPGWDSNTPSPKYIQESLPLESTGTIYIPMHLIS
jgi:hypothetical protein